MLGRISTCHPIIKTDKTSRFFKELNKYLKKYSWEKAVIDFLKYENMKEIIRYINERTEKVITQSECSKLLNNLNLFPALLNTIKADLYLNHAYANERKPYKLLNDLRHIVDSSYCKYFITDNRKLKKIMRRINSRIECRDLDWLIK